MSKLIELNINFDSYKNCFKSIKNINNNNLNNGYKLLSKYKNTFDFRNDSYSCPIYHYDNSFLDILNENNIISEIEKLAGKKVYLFHIQYRNAFKSSNSYQSWHRDTYYKGNKVFHGCTPPVYKAIFYPPINEIKEPCLNLMDNSHLSFKNEGKKFEDYNINELSKKYTDYDKQLDIYPNNKMLIFNTSLYHNACMPNKNNYQTRIIYSFTTDFDKIKNILNGIDNGFDIELINASLNNIIK
jgi:hypothetical protein